MLTAALALVVMITFAASPAESRPGLVAVKVQVDSVDTKAGKHIYLTIAITNNLNSEVSLSCLSQIPSATNAETIGIALQAIYREGREGGSIPVVSKPLVQMPHAVPVCKIRPRGTHTIQTDATKWGIEGGWVPGKYTASILVEEIRVDTQITMRVLSDLFEFRIE